MSKVSGGPPRSISTQQHQVNKPMNHGPVNFPPTPVATDSRLHCLRKRLWIQNDLIVSKQVSSNLTLVIPVGKTLVDIKKTSKNLNSQQFTAPPPPEILFFFHLCVCGGDRLTWAFQLLRDWFDTLACQFQCQGRFFFLSFTSS